MAAPSKFAHVVYQTHRFEEMVAWYSRVFEAAVRHKDDKLAFLSYDDEHHRIAFVNLGPAGNGSAPKKAPGVGVHHVAYTWSGIRELVDTYERLKAFGVLPAHPIRHGLTLSLYYQDPDANLMEFQVDLLDAAEADAFMRGPAFAANPVGEPFDPEELVARVDAGAPVEDVVFRSDQPERRGAAARNGHAPAVRVSTTATEVEAGRDAVAAESAAFLERIEATLPGIRERAAEVERGGRIPDATIGALTDAGLFRAVQPRRWGGLEVHPASFFDAVVRIGSACGSTGWVASVVGVHPVHVALFSDKAQHEVFGVDRDARVSSTYAPTGQVRRVDGGFRLSGRWGFSSGVDHCGWALLGGIVPDEGQGVDYRTFLVPRPDFRIDDASWKVSGLQGTGSKDLVVDAFVPEHRTHRIFDHFHGTDPGIGTNPGPLFRMPWLSMFAYAIAAPAIGAATGALDAFLDDARTRFGVSVGSAAAANPALHLRVAEAAIVIGDARARIASTWNELYGIARGGRGVPVELRAKLRYEGAQAIGACLEQVLGLFEVGGGGVMATRKPFQRLLRDLMGMRNHPFGVPDARASTYAKQLLRLPADPYVPGSLACVI